MSSPTPSTPPPPSPADPAPRSTRRTFTADYRNAIIDEYANAPHGQKSAVLRREGLYQSQLRKWAGMRDRAPEHTPKRRKVKQDNNTDASDRKELDRLTRANSRLEKQLTQTEAALEIMGKLHVLLESISTSTDTPTPPSKR